MIAVNFVRDGIEEMGPCHRQTNSLNKNITGVGGKLPHPPSSNEGSGVGSKGREHTAKQEGKVRDCSKLTTLFVMELKKNGPRHRQTKGPNKKTTVESFFRGKWGGNITALWWTI